MPHLQSYPKAFDVVRLDLESGLFFLLWLIFPPSLLFCFACFFVCLVYVTEGVALLSEATDEAHLLFIQRINLSIKPQALRAVQLIPSVPCNSAAHQLTWASVFQVF